MNYKFDEELTPNLDSLKEEYVLVQAWKKTAAYIRYHNWYSDTLELDRTAINLPRFLAELAERLGAPDAWTNDPLRIVLAPKSQRWRVTGNPARWEPLNTDQTSINLRPLAHVSLKDQVAATAVMLCLANRVETAQGDPRGPVCDTNVRNKVISYGNRLFCDSKRNALGSKLDHRWGSSKLYRAYYQDYHSFLTRPEVVAAELSIDTRSRIVVVQSDLRQFYDRVRPSLLEEKILNFKNTDDDNSFYVIARKLLNWSWHSEDLQEVSWYSKISDIFGFEQIALPQGLVASGFFSNVALIDFDAKIKDKFHQNILPGICLNDACRYVDDLRLVVTVDRSMQLDDVQSGVASWIKELLSTTARGLELSEEKTHLAVFREDSAPPLVRQSRKMTRIQGAISGGFDAIAGEKILDAVQGLMRSQQRYSEQRIDGQSLPFMPIPDVRDSTVTRFAAGRYRSTYRSLRPLLADESTCSNVSSDILDDGCCDATRGVRTRTELDDEAKTFALGLIESWVEDPSNVRLLRIGLDIYPSIDTLKVILALLRPFIERSKGCEVCQRVAWYCLAEIFRAGATETGFVQSDESFPEGIDLVAYRKGLQEEAFRLIVLPVQGIPWYLKQQALLYLSVCSSQSLVILDVKKCVETQHYLQLIHYLHGRSERMNDDSFATLSILARRSFCNKDRAIHLVLNGIDPNRIELIAAKDPSFALEIMERRKNFATEVSSRVREDLCLRTETPGNGWVSLATIVLQNKPNWNLQNELSLLQFARAFLEKLRSLEIQVITPADVLLKEIHGSEAGLENFQIQIKVSTIASDGSIYCPPGWCPSTEKWRFHLGYILRFILSSRQDFTRIVRKPHWKEVNATYRPSESHWIHRLYGMFNGQLAFGKDWLPITDWTEWFLFSLLRWPGCSKSEKTESFDDIEAAIAIIGHRIEKLHDMRGSLSNTLILPFQTTRPTKSTGKRPLRACVMQTVIPEPLDFEQAGDITLSSTAFRRKHRNHLSSALSAIKSMLDLRETHKGCDGRLDWLILPELSVHPLDVKTHLIPFSRAYKTIILAGLTYEELVPGQPKVNSAIWVIPTWSRAHGLQTITRRQCKQHLSPGESLLNSAATIIHGFRPCQWLVGYDWSNEDAFPPLWLTASICYDATDISLVADLRNQSDVFAIPALNKDVSTFDQMSLALHYHMFQLVTIANNGLFGGSNAYAPYREAYQRQIFHLHGQPQATLSFFEIDDIAAYQERKNAARKLAGSAPSQKNSPKWKNPPAGM